MCRGVHMCVYKPDEFLCLTRIIYNRFPYKKYYPIHKVIKSLKKRKKSKGFQRICSSSPVYIRFLYLSILAVLEPGYFFLAYFNRIIMTSRENKSGFHCRQNICFVLLCFTYINSYIRRSIKSYVYH